MDLSFIQMLIAFLIIYLCVYALVDRVMRYNEIIMPLPGIEVVEEEKDEQKIDNE